MLTHSSEIATKTDEISLQRVPTPTGTYPEVARKAEAVAIRIGTHGTPHGDRECGGGAPHDSDGNVSFGSKTDQHANWLRSRLQILSEDR